MSGFASSIWRSVKGRQVWVSCGVGVRLPGEADRRHHAVEELAGTADEGQAFEVLFAPGRLADEHHPRLRIAGGEHQLLRRLAQPAALEAVEQGAEVFQARGVSCQFARRHDGGIRRRRGVERGRNRRRARGCTRKQGRAGRFRRGSGDRQFLVRRSDWGGLRIRAEAVHRLFLQHGIDAGLHIEGEDRAQIGIVGIHGHEA